MTQQLSPVQGKMSIYDSRCGGADVREYAQHYLDALKAIKLMASMVPSIKV